MKNLSFYVIVILLWLVPGTLASPVQWPVNGHYYEAILVPEGITWTAADLAASSKEGDWHLATISSAEENAFIYDLVDDPAFWKFVGSHGLGPWLGGYIYDISDSYTSAFIFCLIFYCLACLAVWIAAPRKTVKNRPDVK